MPREPTASGVWTKSGMHIVLLDWSACVTFLSSGIVTQNLKRNVKQNPFKTFCKLLSDRSLPLITSRHLWKMASHFQKVDD